jgi:quercetin dioxygenase-like cupin family protein
MGIEPPELFIGPADGKVLTNPLGGEMMIKLRDRDTSGAYSVHANVIPAGSPGPRPHIHRNHDEVFYVIEGEITVRIGARRIVAPAGSFVVVPRGEVHKPANPGSSPARVLLIFSPSGMDTFFEEAAERRMPLAQVPSDPETLKQLVEFTARFAYEFADDH